MDVAGMTAGQADEVRRAFARPNGEHLVVAHRQRFLEGALKNGVSEEVAAKIFAKINGSYMFPESHSHALCRHRLPGCLAQALLPPGVLRRPDQQSADGLLPNGDA